MSDRRLAKPKPKAKDHTQHHTHTHTDKCAAYGKQTRRRGLKRTKDTENGLKLARANAEVGGGGCTWHANA